MIKEELSKEATTTVQWECTPMIDRPTFINGYITGAEPREKRIAELQEENKQAKEIIREYVRIAYEEFNNEFDARFANRDLLEKAEAFLKG